MQVVREAFQKQADNLLDVVTKKSRNKYKAGMCFALFSDMCSANDTGSLQKVTTVGDERLKGKDKTMFRFYYLQFLHI